MPLTKLIATVVVTGVLLASCSPKKLDIEEAQKVLAELRASDPPAEPRGPSITAQLNIFDAITRQPIADVIIVGSARGQLKDEYVGHEKVPLVCKFLPVCYSEHERSVLAIGGPRVATRATITEATPTYAYRIETPGAFVLAPSFNKVTKYYSWEGTIVSKNYCGTTVGGPSVDGRSAMHAVAAAYANRPNDYSNHPVFLRPLGTDSALTMRYRLGSRWLLAGLNLNLTGVSIEPTSPRADLYREILGWAAPSSNSVFEHLAYTSYLLRIERELSGGADVGRSQTELGILRELISAGLVKAQQAYYEFDDWQLVPETARVEWGDPTARSGAAECLRPDVSARVGPSRWWNTATPLQDEARLREGLKPYPFCVANLVKELTTILRRECEQNSTAWRAWDPEAYKWHPADGFMRPPNASHPEKAVPPVGYSTSGERTTTVRRAGTGANVNGGTNLVQRAPTCETQASSRISAMQARPRFKVQCRHGDAKKCNLNALNPFGDTALMSLARVDHHGVNAYPFSRVPDRPQSGWQPSNVFHSRRYTRYEAMRMMEALLRSGADPTPVHPVLGVNALETAIDPFIGGSLRSDTGGAWEAQAEMVGFLVSAFENNPRATIRADYLKAIERLAVVNEVRPLSYGEKPWPKLDATLIARMQKLPSRPEPRLCGESVGYPGPGWVQSPPVLLGHQTASPVDLR